MTTAEATETSGAQQVREWYDNLPEGTQFTIRDAHEALPHLVKKTIATELGRLRRAGVVGHNGKKAIGAAYKKPKAKRERSAPAQREEHDPIGAIPEIPPRQPVTEIEIHKGASGGTTVFLPDALPADSEWRELFTVPDGYKFHIDTLVDGRQVLFIQRNE